MCERSMVYRMVWAAGTQHSLGFRYYQTGFPFDYDLVQYLYQKPEFQIEHTPFWI